MQSNANQNNLLDDEDEELNELASSTVNRFCLLLH